MDKCLFCKKELELVNDNAFQPYGGGEVQFIFAFGSAKFDYNITCTKFAACICDDCAEKYVQDMKEV